MSQEHTRAAHRDPSAAAMEAVLEAERVATSDLQRRRAAAAHLVEQARDAARDLVNRAVERAARRRERHAQALALRVRLLQDRARAQQVERPVDLAAVQSAVERLAARLTGDDAAR